MSDFKIKAEDIYAATENGKAVILHFYPQSAVGFSNRRNFSIRGADDRKPSCTVFEKSGKWWLQDKGGDDTKAYDAISLTRREMNLSYPQALEWIAQRFAPHLLDDSGSGQAMGPKPDIQEVPPQDEITVETRDDGLFTDAELRLLGREITQEICDMFCLKPVKSYITRRNAKGKSFRISGNEGYPIYFYDYGSYGKIYQPLGELRFMWTGHKPENLISGERAFLDMYAKASDSSGNPFLVPRDPEDSESVEQDLQWKELIICSGPSDALNVRRAGYHVCWLNSETADLSDKEYATLTKIAKKIYILYDIDETGITQMYRIAKKFLDISIIKLPADLKEVRTRSGKPCKDAKDFFMHYNKTQGTTIDRLFDGLVKLSGGLQFWQEKRDRKGNFIGYDINNSQLYAFLEASGFYTISDSGKKYTYCRIKDNVVTVIDSSEISMVCVNYLQEFITSHPQYYRQALANAIFRSPQLQESSLRNLRRVAPNFDAYTAASDFFFFRNGIFKVSRNGIEKVKPSECPYMVYSDKIIQHDFSVSAPLFTVDWSDEYAAKRASLAAATPHSPNFASLKKETDAVRVEKRYKLEISDNEFDFLRFVYNTGKIYWQKEEAGFALSDDEIREHDHNFIAKVASIGYLLSRFKDQAKAYGVYAMETEQGSVGEHRGGTGKSLLMQSVSYLRKQVYIDGQAVKSDKMEFILQQVKPGVTDNIYVDDLNAKVDMHRFMNWITGQMEVNAKYADQVTISFRDSPKVSYSANHAMANYDNSLKRRTWFVAMSDYYHAEDEMNGVPFRSPETEFGRTLLQDYSPEDMNRFYNFMFDCIMVWKKFNVRIQPAMRKLEQRNLQRAMTDEFLWWAEDYFTDDKLNQLLDKDKLLEDYKATLPKTMAENIKPRTFRNKLVMFCQYKDYVFNPKCLLRTATEKDRNEIRKKIHNEDKYYFYIDTTREEQLPVNSILGQSDGEGGDAAPGEDMPIFG